MCCMLGKYDASYPYLFCCSYETVETDFPICEIFIFILTFGALITKHTKLYKSPF